MLELFAATVLVLLTSITPAIGMGKAAIPLSAGLEGHARQALANGECFTARSLVEQMIAAGEPIGYSVRGEMYERGVCAPRDWSKAAKSYGLATRHGHWLAQAHLGYLALSGGPGLPRDVGWAIELFRSLALDLAALEPEHRPTLVRALMRQRGIPQQLADAMAWVREIETLTPHKLLDVALKLKSGSDGLPQKKHIARDWMREAARRGSVAARLQLALWLLDEPSARDDIETGLHHLFFAAREGHGAALKEYGRRLAEGDEVTRDDLGAYVVLVRARDAGVAVNDLLPKVRSRLPPSALRKAEFLLSLDWYLPAYDAGS